MKKIILLLAVLVGTVVLLCSCDCKHEHCSEATCTTHSTCLDCGEIISEALEHTYGEWTIDKDATCTEQGQKSRICECGEKETETISAKGHTDIEWITAPNVTCTKIHIREQVCTICSVTIKTEVISAKAHTDGDWIVDKEANCTEDGSKHQVCSVCEATIKTETLTKLGHTDGEWITDKEANCTEDGSKHRVCSVCTATITEAIAAKGHADGEWITDKEANCTEDGSKHQVCSVCEATIKTEPIPNLGGHNHQEISVENNGIVGSKITYKCINCSDLYEKTIEKIVVSVRHTGTSSATMNGYGSYSKFYTASASGGYGDYQYKFEVYTSATASNPSSNLTKDFSSDSSYGISYRGYENAISGYILQVTVKDEAGNQTVYRYEF